MLNILLIFVAPFYPSDDEDENSLDDEEPFHSFYPTDSSAVSGDLDDPTLQQFPMSHEQAEYFLEADDPALLDELEEQFMFEWRD